MPPGAAAPSPAVLVRRLARTPAGLRPVARALRPHLRPGTVVELVGDLGAGKTTLVRALCAELGVPGTQVRSPSFTLINEYRGALPVFHIDLYRIGDPSELPGLGLDELLQAGGVCFVEWPERVAPGLARRAGDVIVIELTRTGRGEERLVVARRG